MKKWTNELNRDFFQTKNSNSQKAHEEMLNIPGHKGNANKNYINFTSLLLE
jgi:hypothetical protein